MQNHKTLKFQQQMQTTTIRPEIQSTTNRAEVLKLLQQLLASVKPSSPQPTKMSVMTTVRTTRMAVPVTAAATVAPSTATTRRLTVKRQPSLTFDDPHPVLTVSITPPHLSPTVTPGTQIHPHSPFPRLEPPRHDLLGSNLFLPHPMQGVTPASPVHPHSPFPHLEAPKESLEPQYSPAVPRSGMAGFFSPPLFDPARPQLNQEDKPGPFKLNLGTGQAQRNGRKFNAKSGPKFPSPNTGLNAPPPMLPVSRTRQATPRSQRVDLTRKLSIDGPTEASLTPLEILAMETVPRYKPDNSFFGTPKSRVLDNQGALEILSGSLQGDVAFQDFKPVERTRFQRTQDWKPILDSPSPMKTHHVQSQAIRTRPKGEDFNKLPGVISGTTAVGIVEHRHKHQQPRFHVPIFTTPMPQNGKFVSRNLNPLQKLQSGLQNIRSSIGSAISRIPGSLPNPTRGLANFKAAIKKSLGVTRRSDIPITPSPHPPAIVSNFKEVPRRRNTGIIGRRLDTFSRYTKVGSFRRNSAKVESVKFETIFLMLLSAFYLTSIK